MIIVQSNINHFIPFSVHYLKTIAKNPLARDKAIIIFVEALEDPSPEIRCAACVALKHLAATESLKQLVYLCQTETSPHVKQRAKDTLISFGGYKSCLTVVIIWESERK